MKKRFLALLLTLVMALALTVPALAEEEKKVLTLEDVNFSVAPIGIAKFEFQMTSGGEGFFYRHVYVFDQDCTASLKDGRGFTGTGSWKAVETPEGTRVAEGEELLQSFQFSASSPGVFWFGFCEEEISGGERTGYVYETEACYMTSKAYVDELMSKWSNLVTLELFEQTSTQPTQPAAGTYTVKKWDTWGQIALNNYGTYSKAVWTALKNANKGAALKEGVSLVLPEKIGSYTCLAPQVLAEGEQFYTVKAGDTLGSIAASYYGSIKRYIDIFNRNSDRLKSANMIYEGQVLVLPAK